MNNKVGAFPMKIPCTEILATSHPRWGGVIMGIPKAARWCISVNEVKNTRLSFLDVLSAHGRGLQGTGASRNAVPIAGRLPAGPGKPVPRTPV